MNKTSLKRFFSNQCSPVEREEIIRWLLDPSNDLLIKHWLRDHWESLPVDELVSVDEEPDMEQLWGKIRSRIKEDQLDLQQGSASPKFPKIISENWLSPLCLLVYCSALILYTQPIHSIKRVWQMKMSNHPMTLLLQTRPGQS